MNFKSIENLGSKPNKKVHTNTYTCMYIFTNGYLYISRYICTYYVCIFTCKLYRRQQIEKYIKQRRDNSKYIKICK